MAKSSFRKRTAAKKSDGDGTFSTGHDESAPVGGCKKRRVFVVKSDSTTSTELPPKFTFFKPPVKPLVVKKKKSFKKLEKKVESSSQYKVSARVIRQLKDARLGALKGKLTTSKLIKLLKPGVGKKYLEYDTGRVNTIVKFGSTNLRITLGADLKTIISVGPVRDRNICSWLTHQRFKALDEEPLVQPTSFSFG